MTTTDRATTSFTTRSIDTRSIAVGLATALLIGAAALVNREAPAEGRYLAIVCIAVLGLTTPAAFPGGSLGFKSWGFQSWRFQTWYVAALLAGTAALALPAGAVRGTGTSCALVLALAAAIPTSRRTHFGVPLLASAIALQLVLRSSTLLHVDLFETLPSPRNVVVWFGLPFACALAARLALDSRGPRVVAAALLTLILACGGFTVTATLAMWVTVGALSLEKVLAAGTKTRVSKEWPTLRLLGLSAALGAACLWHLPTGLLLVTLATLLVVRGLGIAVLLVVAGILTQWGEPRDWSTVASEAPRLLLLLPFAAASWVFELRAWAPTRSLRWLSGVALLTIVALRTLEAEAALALPVLLVLFGRTTLQRQPKRAVARTRALKRAALGHQTVWAGCLLGVAALSASYPWLRWPDFDRLPELTGWHSPSSLWGLGLVTVVAAIALVLAAVSRTTTSRLVAPAYGGLAILALGVLIWRPSLSVHDWPPVTFDATSSERTWQLPESARSTSEAAEASGAEAWLFVQSALTNSTSLPEGTVVATVTTLADNGARHTQELRVGEHTGDWAAVTVDSPAPTPWLHWVEPEGRFFGQRYRARLRLPAGATALVIERDAQLPSDVEFVLYAVSLGH